jgi:hypothetical protein
VGLRCGAGTPRDCADLLAEVPAACDKTAKDLACDIVKDTLSHYSKFYEKIDTVDDTVEMVGGDFIRCFGL